MSWVRFWRWSWSDYGLKIILKESDQLGFSQLRITLNPHSFVRAFKSTNLMLPYSILYM